MRRSRLSRAKQERLIEHFVAGTTARTAAALIGVHRNTSAYYIRRLRQLVSDHVDSATAFAGEVEIDESCFGGRRKGKRGRGSS